MGKSFGHLLPDLYSEIKTKRFITGVIDFLLRSADFEKISTP